MRTYTFIILAARSDAALPSAQHDEPMDTEHTMQTSHTLASRSAAITLLALALSACGSDASTGVEPSNDTAGATVNGQISNSSNSTTTASRCNGTLGAITVEEVNVPSGATCTLNGTRVRGDVKVRTGASLIANGASVDGNIQAEDALTVATRNGTFVDGDIQVKRRATARIESTTITGNLQIEESGASLVSSGNRIGGDLQVKKARTASITSTSVNGNIQLEENSGLQSSTGANVRGNLQASKNLGGVRLNRNRVAQAMQCKENSPAPTGSGNIAGEKEDQCRRL